MIRERGGESFPKTRRLLERRQYLAVQHGGRRVSTEHFIVQSRPNGGRPTRLGITVSRKVGNAVVRNRIKRLCREVFRREAASLPQGLDLVMVGRPGRPAVDLEAVRAEFLDALARLRRGDGKRRRRR